PAGPLHHQRPAPVRDQRADRGPLVIPQPRPLARQRPQARLRLVPQLRAVLAVHGRRARESRLVTGHPSLVPAAAVRTALPVMSYSGANIGSLWAGTNGLAVAAEATEKIKAMITSGALRAGDRLPREADLAAELGLSRSSLREAVRALSLVNILDVRRGDGTYVTSLEPRLLLEALSFIVDFHRDDTLLEFLRVRRILEPAATAMAAERVTDAEVADLRELLDRLGPHPEVDDLVANDLEFHRRIAVSSGNSVLCS